MQDGLTPVHVAAQNGHNKTLALLLANKADVNSANKVQRRKYSNFNNCGFMCGIFTRAEYSS
jgi:ankyrin repeat protein